VRSAKNAVVTSRQLAIARWPVGSRSSGSFSGGDHRGPAVRWSRDRDWQCMVEAAVEDVRSAVVARLSWDKDVAADRLLQPAADTCGGWRADEARRLLQGTGNFWSSAGSPKRATEDGARLYEHRGGYWSSRVATVT
jgi:hypothetical protein